MPSIEVAGSTVIPLFLESAAGGCPALLPLLRQNARLAAHVLALLYRVHRRLLGGDGGDYHLRYLFP